MSWRILESFGTHKVIKIITGWIVLVSLKMIRGTNKSNIKYYPEERGIPKKYLYGRWKVSFSCCSPTWLQLQKCFRDNWDEMQSLFQICNSWSWNTYISGENLNYRIINLNWNDFIKLLARNWKYCKNSVEKKICCVVILLSKV